MYTFHMYTEYVAFEKVSESMIFFDIYYTGRCATLTVSEKFSLLNKTHMYTFVCNEEQYLSSTVS